MDRERFIRYSVGFGISVTLFSWVGVLDILLFSSTEVWMYQLGLIIGLGVILLIVGIVTSYYHDYLIPASLGLMYIPLSELMIRLSNYSGTPANLTQAIATGVIFTVITVYLAYEHRIQKQADELESLEQSFE